ncbi:hypothetical protein [Desulfobacter latus]|uniref:Uncharacterized protein n=1 Tax=Desulfobacter latus TaxID=2292 RepID=A0A850T536_9BACT|nr:hypothetical protein [Desulfobacter latus]NWH03398.1 hypothetical protein [Desulfobacter latus]
MIDDGVLINRVASDDILDQAYDWVCSRRRDYSHNSDIWELRRNWQDIKPILQQALRSGNYSFGTLREIRTESGRMALWNAQDALVLKGMALVLGTHLKGIISDNCHHVEGHGGAKKAIRNATEALVPGSHVVNYPSAKDRRA